jgi:predicted PurR-regulated permease PerM
MKRETVNTTVLLLVVFFISALFLSMIRSFFMALFLAALFSALIHPVYRRFLRWFRGRRSLAALLSLVLLILFVLLPLTGLMGIVTAQAIKVGNSVTPWVEQQIREPDILFNKLQALPVVDRIVPYREEIIKKAGEMVGSVSGFLINKLSSATLGTMQFFFMLFVLLYSMYFFLMDGKALVEKILFYLPLHDQDEKRMLERFTSVGRATLKGTAVIGILQGGLAGAAFAVAGIPSAIFWGLIMVVLSIIPAIGSALIWVPAVIVLAVSGHMAKAIGLALFCGLVVGTLDNLLRPILVGKDTQMHELMIFLGTLGGIFMFGVAGFIIGPIIAALFLTAWEIYGESFRDFLPAVHTAAPLPDQPDSGSSPE